MGDFNSKYTGQAIEELLDLMTDSDIVASVDTSDELEDVSNDFITSQQLDARNYATMTFVQNLINSAITETLNTPL